MAADPSMSTSLAEDHGCTRDLEKNGADPISHCGDSGNAVLEVLPTSGQPRRRLAASSARPERRRVPPMPGQAPMLVGFSSPPPTSGALSFCLQ